MARSSTKPRAQVEADYRQRFLDALDAQESLERDAGRRVAELASLLARAGRALGVDGDRKLARGLEALSARLRERPLDPALARDMSAVRVGLLEFMDASERARESERAGQLDALTRCADQLEGVLTSWRARGALKRFRKRLRGSGETPQLLIGALADLHAQIPSPDALSEPEVSAQAAAESPPVEEPAAPGEREAAPSAAPRVPASVFDPVPVRAAIVALLERLELPDDAHDQSQRLRDAVSDDFDESTLVQVLETLGELAEQALGAIRSEYGGFLDAVDRQLDALLEAMASAEAAEQAYRLEQDTLSVQMRERIGALRNETEQASDLDALKRSIASHLEELQSGLGRLTRQEEGAIAAREAQLGVMRQRVRALEEESAQARRQLEEQRALAHTDPLTGIANRAGFERAMQPLLARHADGGKPFALAMVDIDHFKQVNDRYGHPAGDQALVLVANILRSRIRASDFCARFGGEEFVVVLEGVDAENARRVIEQLRAFVETCGCNYQGQHIALTASFGLAMVGENEALGDLIDRADRALYQAKRDGRNRVVMDY